MFCKNEMMDDTQAELNQERKQNILHKFLPKNESYFYHVQVLVEFCLLVTIKEHGVFRIVEHEVYCFKPCMFVLCKVYRGRTEIK